MLACASAAAPGSVRKGTTSVAGFARDVASSGEQALTVVVECEMDGALPDRAHATIVSALSVHAGNATIRIQRQECDPVFHVNRGSSMLFRLRR